MTRTTSQFRRVSIMAALACLSLALLAPAAARTFNEPEEGTKGAKTVKAKKKRSNVKMPALAFKMKDIDGKERDLRQYYGDVVLMVNVASRCGYTPQYEGLEKLYKDKKDKGLVILGFPANDFGRQEPGSDSEIKEFCTRNYGVTFPVYSKVSVKGDECCPLYQYLTSKKAGHKHGGDVKWNFSKFLINRKGEVVARYDSMTTPDSDRLLKAIDKALSAPRPADAPKKD